MAKSRSAILNETLGPKEVETVLLDAMSAKIPTFIWGPPGIGKSDVIFSIAKKQNRQVVDLRLLLMEPTDMKGIPFYDMKTGNMRWAPSSELPTNTTQADVDKAEKRLAMYVDSFVAFKESATEADKKTIAYNNDYVEFENTIAECEAKLEKVSNDMLFQDCILFLDELSAAPPSVQASAYQLVLDRKIGEYTLPDGVDIVAAGNRDSDRGVVYKMPTPLANRFMHIDMEAKFKDWQQWAVNHDVHPDVIGFLSHSKQSLFDFDPRNSGKAFATPRSWTKVSEVIKTSRAPESLVRVMVSGTVGEGHSGSFMAHRKVASRMPRPEDVLSGKVTKLDVDDISARYSLTIAMCYTLRDHYNEYHKKSDDDKVFKKGKVEWHKEVDHFFKFMMKNFTEEMVVLGAKTALRDYGLDIDHSMVPSFDDFFEDYGEFVLAD